MYSWKYNLSWTRHCTLHPLNELINSKIFLGLAGRVRSRRVNKAYKYLRNLVRACFTAEKFYKITSLSLFRYGNSWTTSCVLFLFRKFRIKVEMMSHIKFRWIIPFPKRHTLPCVMHWNITHYFIHTANFQHLSLIYTCTQFICSVVHIFSSWIYIIHWY